MTTISSATNGYAFLQSLTTTGNWMLDAVSNDTADWLDPSSNGPDAVRLAANAFAKAHLLSTTAKGSLAVNQGIQTQQSALTALSSGQTLNILA